MSWLSVAVRSLVRNGAPTKKKRQLDIELAPYIDMIHKSLPLAELEVLRARHPDSARKKYLDLRRYIRRSVLVCDKTRLIGAPRQRVLDIGCGGGLFMCCAGYFGHEAVGIDIEDALFADMARVFGVDRSIERVIPFRPLSIAGSFDLIVCINATFDRTRCGQKRIFWGCEEWRFFISDIAGRLTPSGRIFLFINRGRRARSEGLDYYDARIHHALLHGHLGRNEYLLDRDSAAIAVANLAH